jgi:hypothetical protein
VTIATITFTDSVGAASFSNLKPSGGSRFDNWTPNAEVIGPTATGLGTGSLHVFEFRTDYIVGLEISKVPATDEVYEKMLRLKLHLERGGLVTLSGGHVLLTARYTTCALAPDTRPTINFSDRTCLEYTFGVVLKGLGGVGVGAHAPDDMTDLGETCDLAFWWKSDSLLGLFAYDDLVNLWPDSGDNNHYGYQDAGDAASRPTFKANEFGTLPGVRFNGTYGLGHWFRIAGDLSSGLEAAEIFIVLKVDHDPQEPGGQPGLWRFSTESGQRTLYPYEDGYVSDDFGSTAIHTIGNPTVDLTTPHLYNVTSMDGEWTARINGTQMYTTPTNSFDTSGFSPANARIGTSSPDAQVFNLRGAIAEVFMYTCKLPTIARANRVAYVKARYPMVAIP